MPRADLLPLALSVPSAISETPRYLSAGSPSAAVHSRMTRAGTVPSSRMWASPVLSAFRFPASSRSTAADGTAAGQRRDHRADGAARHREHRLGLPADP